MSKRGRILVAMSGGIDSTVTAMMLHDEGYEVIVAMDGQSGKALMEKDKYGVVILDLKLPGLNGYEVIKAIKKSPVGSPVIVLSGRPMGRAPLDGTKSLQEKEEERVLTMADEVLNKPVAIPELMGKVRKYTQNM